MSLSQHLLNLKRKPKRKPKRRLPKIKQFNLMSLKEILLWLKRKLKLLLQPLKNKSRLQTKPVRVLISLKGRTGLNRFLLFHKNNLNAQTLRKLRINPMLQALPIRQSRSKPQIRIKLLRRARVRRRKTLAPKAEQPHIELIHSKRTT